MHDFYCRQCRLSMLCDPAESVIGSSTGRSSMGRSLMSSLMFMFC